MGPQVGNLSASSPVLPRCDALQDGVHSKNQGQTQGTHQWNAVAGPSVAPLETLCAFLGSSQGQSDPEGF